MTNPIDGPASMDGDWVTAWSASLGGSFGALMPAQTTIRQGMRVSAGGAALRLRLTNLDEAPLSLVGAVVAIDERDSAGVPVTWSGADEIDVSAGRSILSDPVVLPVEARDRVIVTIASDGPARMTTHDFANALTSLAEGDRRTGSVSDFRPWRTSWAWIDAIDVLRPDAQGAVVVLGDSITDGAGADFGSDTRWTDGLAARLLDLPAGDARRRAVANAGIGGNTVCSIGNAVVGVNALERLERDVLALSAVRELIVLHGTNDAFVETDPEVVMSALERIAERARRAGIRPFIATLAPRVGGLDWTPSREHRRRAINRWIREQRVFDDIIDIERVLIHPGGNGIRPEFDADGTHPNSSGYRAIAESIDLGWFRTPADTQGEQWESA